MNLYEAISCRRAIRKYKKDKISEQLLTQIKNYGKKVSEFCPGILTEIELLEHSGDRTPVTGLWKVDAPYYLVFFSEEKAGYERNAGYVLEQIVLYLEGKGLGSCYLGGSKAPEAERTGMKQLMVVAFGYAEGILYREAAKAKRMSLKELCVFKENVDEQMKTVLKAARLAPSSFNSQPWRFLVYQGRIHVFSCRERIGTPLFRGLREFNIGIMLSHVMIAAEELWLEVEWQQEESLLKKTYKSAEYIGTVVFR